MAAARLLKLLVYSVGFRTEMRDAMMQEDFFEEETVPLEKMACGEVGQTYTLLSRPPASMTTGKLVNILKFKIKEIDPSTGSAIGLRFFLFYCPFRPPPPPTTVGISLCW